MEALIRRLLSVALLAFPVAASAIPVQSGTGTWLTFRDCTGPGGSCSSFSPIVSSSYGGDPGSLFFAQSFTLAGYGTARSESALSGEIGAPILRLSAQSEAGRRINTNTFALQRYTYTGASAAARTFGGTLDYVQSITDPDNALYDAWGGASGIYAEMRVFTSLDEFLETGPTAETQHFAATDFAWGGASGYSLIGEDIHSDIDDALSGFASLSVTVNLNPGDSMWVWAFLQTPAADGSIVDAYNTFITGWDNTENLVPANVYAVPEPGMLALFCLGVAGLASVRRRRWH